MRIYRTAATERISSDDPDASKKIAARIHELNVLVSNAQRANELVQQARKSSGSMWPQKARTYLQQMGVDAGDIERILTLSPKKRYGVPYAEVIASRADIDRLTERFEKLGEQAARPAAPELEIGGARIVENREANRLQVVFKDKPSESVRAALRAHGFLWAPSQHAWQRKLTNDSRSAALWVLRDVYPAASFAKADKAEAEARKASEPGEDRARAAQKPAAPPSPAPAPPTPPKDTMRTGPALKSWEDAPKATAARIRTALTRAEKNSEHRAGVALGRRRLEIRQAGGVFDIFDGKTGEPFPYAKKGPRAKRAARSYSAETPATLKRRLSRERDAEARKSAARERKTKRKETGAKKKATRAELAAKTKEARGLCKTEVQEARTKAPRPKKRLAVAIARTRCAARQTKIELSFHDRLMAAEAELAQLRGRAPAARTTEPRAVPGKKREAREERDDSVRSELQRQGRADLIATWNRVKDGPKFRGLTADRAWEAFSEFLEADEGNAENQARAAAQRSDADHQCAQAQHLGREDPQVALWASENCEDDRAKRPARAAKLSPARRTLTMLDLPNPAEAEERRAGELAAAARRAPKPPKAPRAARGQQSLGSTWTPLVDAGGSQMSLGGRRASRGSDSPIPF